MTLPYDLQIDIKNAQALIAKEREVIRAIRKTSEEKDDWEGDWSVDVNDKERDSDYY